MKKELEDKLFEKYKTLFPNGRNIDPKESLLHYGIETGDGWFSLIDKLCIEILKVDSKCIAVQVKQKFGQLRFYTKDCNQEVFDLIMKAEKESSTICEICGEPGKLMELNGWLMTRCNQHKDLRKCI